MLGIIASANTAGGGGGGASGVTGLGVASLGGMGVLDMRSTTSIALFDTKKAFIGTGNGDLVAVDYSDPDNLVFLDSLINHASLTDGQLQLFVDGDVLFAWVNFTGTLTAWDITDPTNITFIDSVIAQAVGPTADQVAKVGDLFFIGDDIDNELKIVNVADPNNMTVVGEVAIAGVSYTRVSANANTAFVTHFGNGVVNNNLISIDVSNPALPVVLQTLSINMPGGYTLLDGNYLYISRTAQLGTDAFAIYDVSDPSNMVRVGGFNHSSAGSDGGVVPAYLSRICQIDANYVAVCDGVRDSALIIDVSDKAAPEVILILPTSPAANEIVPIVWDGEYLITGGSFGIAFFGLEIDGTWSAPVAPTIETDAPDVTTLSSIYQPLASLAILVDGNYAYVAGNTHITVFDVTNPDAPVFLTAVSSSTASFGSLYRNGNYLFKASGGADRVDIFDVTNPALPVFAKTITSTTSLDGVIQVIVEGGLMYAANQVDDQVAIFDASDVLNMTNTPIGTVTNTQLDAIGGMVKDGNLLYCTAINTDRLTIVNVATPATPTISGSVTATSLDQARRIVKDGNYCYIATSPGRLTIVDVTNPAAPTVAGTVLDATNLAQARALVKVGNYCYVVGTTMARVTAVDVSVVATPTVVGNTGSFTQLQAESIAVKGTKLLIPFLGTPTTGHAPTFSTVDISTATSPTLSNSYYPDRRFDEPKSIVRSDDSLFVAVASGDRVTSIDVTDPEAPVIDSFVYDTTLDSVNNLVIDGVLAYATVPSVDRLTILNISDPSAITVTGSLLDTTNLDGVNYPIKDGNYVYVITSNNRLSIVDVSNPAVPVLAGTLQDNTNFSSPRALAKVGNLCYLVSLSSGVFGRVAVVDVSNVALPVVGNTIVGVDNGPLEQPSNVFHVGNYLYVGGQWGLAVVDITAPTVPVLTGYLLNYSIALTGDYVIEGDYMYLPTGGGVAVIDISAPATPKLAHRGRNFISAAGLAKVDDQVFVSSSSGDAIYRYTLIEQPPVTI